MGGGWVRWRGGGVAGFGVGGWVAFLGFGPGDAGGGEGGKPPRVFAYIYIYMYISSNWGQEGDMDMERAPPLGCRAVPSRASGDVRRIFRPAPGKGTAPKR